MWVDKENQDENQPNTQSVNNPSIGSGGGAEIQGSTTPSTGTPSSVNPTPQASKQQFGTIQDYFKGNQNQGEQLGQQFTNKLADTAQQQQNTIGQASTQAKNDITANTVNYDPGLVNTAVTDPTKVTGNEDQLNTFLKQWNADYKGPASLETTPQYGGVATAANRAKETAEQLKSTGGRQQLLQDEFGVYGQGNKGLDAALLEQSSYFPKTQEQSKTFGSIQDYLTGQSQDIATQAQQARAATEATKSQTQNAFTNNLTNFQDKLNKSVQAQREYERPHHEVRGGKPVNVDTDITAANVASPQEYANAEAFKKLTGTDYSGVLNPANAEQAGTGNVLRRLEQERTAVSNDSLPDTARQQIQQLEQERASILSGNDSAANKAAANQAYDQQIANIRKPYEANIAGATQAYDQEIAKLKAAGAYSKGGVVKPQNLSDYFKREKR